MKTIKQYQNLISKTSGIRASYENTIKDLEKKINRYDTDLISLEEAQTLFQVVAQRTQENLRYQIEGIVQMAIDTCFPGRYSFKTLFEIKRGKTEARIVFEKNGNEIDPVDSSGGGIVDLTGFALRIACWSLGKTRNTIILDEAFKHLSVDLQPSAGHILRELSDKLKLQFIIVTHSPALNKCADRVFRVSINDGESEVTIDADAREE